MSEQIITAIGSVSAAVVLTAYAGVTWAGWSPQSGRYLLANLFGSAVALWYLWVLSAWASVAVQVFWLAITLLAITRSLK